MGTKKKMLQATAGNAGGGAALDITDVFSTYLYEGNGSTQTITNGIDLGGKGGAILTKRRDSTSGSGPWFNDTERGITKYISTPLTDTGGDSTASISAATSTGYTLGGAFSGWNNSAGEYVSWTFRKAPKFFDVVTYTGTGTAQTIAHNLRTTVGWLLIKRTDSTGSWFNYHHGLSKTGDPQALILNETGTAFTANASLWNLTYPTSTHFTVGDNSSVNASGATYVAYLFAHNDGDGEFGPDGDQDIIKCGVFTDSASGGVVDLGWEPQWVLVKNAEYSGHWFLLDNMRGYTVSGINDNYLLASTSGVEATYDFGAITSTGFTYKNDAVGENIYIAIRRGPLAPPEDATEVFGLSEDTVVAYTDVGFPVDMVLGRSTTIQDWRNFARMIGGNFLVPNLPNTEASLPTGEVLFDSNDGFYNETNGTPNIWYQWKRAPGFFDVVAYTGDGTANQTFSHGLAAKPDMVWIKNRSRSQSGDWWVGLDDSIVTLDGRLNDTGDFGYNVMGTFTDTTVQTLYQNQFATNYSGDKYIAYLFASLPGISKVGSYTGNGSSTGDTQTIDCGFSSGARFVLIKRTSGTGEWFVFDTERGIVAGSDAYLTLHSTAAQVSGGDYIDPHSSGFTVVQHPATETNTLGDTYMFYAIA
jgi:hypothetical protein